MNKVILLTTTAIFLAGCSVTTSELSQTDMTEAATRQMSMMFSADQEFAGDLDMNTAVERALYNNLSSRLRALESGFAKVQTRVDSLEMLPTLAANAGYNKKTTDGYSTSQIFGQAAATGTYSRGSDAESGTSDMTVTWNILDFALGYYNAKQSADRAFIAQERERQASHDLIKNTKVAFWRAYAAERMQGQISRTANAAEATLTEIQQGEQNGSIPHDVALSQRRTVLEALRQLEVLAQDMSIAKLELAQIINVAPGTKLSFAKEPMSVPKIAGTLPELEQLAFENNPGLREQMYRERISATDVRRTVASIFPSIGLTGGRSRSQDTFLMDNTWNQVGLNAGLNLMRLTTAPVRIQSAELGKDVELARSLSVRMAVLAQTNIAYEQFRFARQQFDRANDLYAVDQALAEQVSARKKASSASGVEVVVSDTSAILSRLRLYQAYATLLGASESLHASVGDDSELAAMQNRLKAKQDAANADVLAADQSLEQLNQNQHPLELQLRAMARNFSAAETAMARAVKAKDRADARLQTLTAAVGDAQPTERQSAQIAALTTAAESANTDLANAKQAVDLLSGQIAEAKAKLDGMIAEKASTEQAQQVAVKKLEAYKKL